MSNFADIERLRRQNVSLVRRLQENQHELRHAVHTTRDTMQSASGYQTTRLAIPANHTGSLTSAQHSTNYRSSPTHSLNINPVHVTSTPKHPSLRANSSGPTHRARTEILDTAPQEILSDSAANQFGYSLRLGARQDDSFFTRPPERSSPKESPKKKTRSASKQRLARKSRIGYKTRRRSPRNVSFVNAPGETVCPSELSSVSRHRVLNENVQRGRAPIRNRQPPAFPPDERSQSKSMKSTLSGRTPVRKRPQSAVFIPESSPNKSMKNTHGGTVRTLVRNRPQSAYIPEPSPIQQRYNMRRPNTATPKFGLPQIQVDQSLTKAPDQYQSQFLNSYYANECEENVEEIRVQRSCFPSRLLDDGNVRTPRSARGVVDTTPKPKSILLTPANRSVKGKNSMRVSFRDSPNTSSATMRSCDLDSSAHVQPLLGYDWIAGLLDTNESEKTEGYLAELQEFRSNNYEDCVHKSFVDNHDSILNTSRGNNQEPAVEVEEKAHKCIHNYTLNSRLFPVPLHGNETGESLCAICDGRRKLDSNTVSPSYIRVSVPRSTLRSPYQVRPHRRKSFDPTDSVGLSQHCLAGWENSVPSMMPAASNIDLKDSLGYSISQSQSLFMDREDTTGQPARARHPLVPSNETQRLLNRSRSLRLDLQNLERAGLSQATAANVSQYPVL